MILRVLLRPRFGNNRTWAGYQNYATSNTRPLPSSNEQPQSRRIPPAKETARKRADDGAKAGAQDSATESQYHDPLTAMSKFLKRLWQHRYDIASRFLFGGFIVLTFGHTVIENLCSINPCLGPSMLPTLNVNSDWVLISKLHAKGRGIYNGDLVSFDHPIRQGYSSIKRVVGMPGDFVLRDTPGEGDGILIQVPRNHCWVAGDNLEWSRDSRHFGPLPLSLVRGKVIARVLPFKEQKLLGGEFEDYEGGELAAE